MRLFISLNPCDIAYWWFMVVGQDTKHYFQKTDFEKMISQEPVESTANNLMLYKKICIKH